MRPLFVQFLRSSRLLGHNMPYEIIHLSDTQIDGKSPQKRGFSLQKYGLRLGKALKHRCVIDNEILWILQ